MVAHLCLRISFLLLFSGQLVFSQSQPTVEVKLLSFEAAPQGAKVRLQWSTESERNNKEFVIYRSIDRENWFVSNIIPAHTHGGVRQYDFVDQNTSGGINYYKLEASDASGNHLFLGATAVELEDLTKAVKIIPNREVAQIKLESAEQLVSIELQLFDYVGRIYRVDYVRDNSHEITIVTPHLEPGMYYLLCNINGKRTVRKKAAFI